MNKLLKDFETSKKVKLLQLAVIVLLSLAVILFWILSPDLRAFFLSKPVYAAFMGCVVILAVIYIFSGVTDFILYKRYSVTMHEYERLVYFDSLTGIPDRKCVDQLISYYKADNRFSRLGCCLVSLSNIDLINKISGKEIGNNSIREFAHILARAGENFGLVARNGGSLFVCLIEECNEARMKQFIGAMQRELNIYNAKPDELSLRAVYGYTLNEDTHFTTFSDLFSESFLKLKHHSLEKGTL